MMKKKVGIYIHFPFCRRLCFYCHFNRQYYQHTQVRQYLNYLQKEAKLRQNTQYTIDTIYLGGGSPSLLSPSELEVLVGTIHKHFTIAPGMEFTIEMNPEDINREALRIFSSIGINRVSLGVQSFMAEDLHFLTRTHTPQQNLRAIHDLHDFEITNINLDFIIGLPGQTEANLENNYRIAREQNITHISAYLLEGLPESEDQTHQHNVYHFTRQILKSLGYQHYEVSNYGRRGLYCKHNLKYWRNQEYIGLGLSASGFEDNMDYQNHDDLYDYMDKIKRHCLPIKSLKRMDLNHRAIVTGLRLLRGIPIDNFDSHQGMLNQLVTDGFLLKTQTRVKVNPEKILLLNDILQHFL
jgi:oxygen-independent coproporphyrinogen-3 oxidase